MFDRQRDPGLWTFDSVIQGAELEYWDDAISNSLDMDGGGTYAPAADIVVGGAPGVDWTFSLPVKCDDDFSVFGAVTFLDDLTVTGVSHLNDVEIDGLHVFEEATFSDETTFDADVTCNDGLETFGLINAWGGIAANQFSFGGGAFQDLVTFYGDVDINGDVDVIGAVRFNSGSVRIATSLEIAGGPVTFGNDGRIPQRYTVGPNSNASFTPTAHDHVYVPEGGIDADRSYSIDDLGAVNGDRMRFTNADTGQFIFVKGNGGATIIGLKFVTDQAYWCDVQRIGGVWTLVASGPRFT